MNSARRLLPTPLLLAAAPLVLCTNLSAQVPTASDNTRITAANKNVGRLLELSNDTIAAAQITLLDLLHLEYRDPIHGLTRQQETTRFDVVAKIDPPGVVNPEHNPLAQKFLIDALLKNHFHLKAHEAMVDVTTEQLLSTPNNTKLTPSPQHCPCSRTITATNDHVKGQRISMLTLAKELSKQLGIEVSDNTKLQGTYQIDFNWSPEPSPSPQSPEKPLREALEKQLGLTLQPSHRLEWAIVVDYIDLPADVIRPEPQPDPSQTASSSSNP